MAWGRTLGAEIAPEGPPIREGEDETQLKVEYARIAHRLGTDWPSAGFALFQGVENYGRAMQAKAWINDFVVQNEMARLRENPAETLPSDDEIEQDLINIARDKVNSARDRTAAFAIVLEMRGKIKKPANTNINTGTITNNVLRVPAKPQTDEEREAYAMRLKVSQMKLVSDAKSSSR